MGLQVVNLPTLPEWQQVIVILGLTFLIAVIIRFGMSAWIKRTRHLTATDLDRVVFEELLTPLYLTVIFSGIYLVLPYLEMPRFEFVAGGLIISVIVILWARAGIKLVSRVIVSLREQGREPDFAPVLKNLWTFFLVIGALFTLLAIWEIDITPLLAGAGVAGIVIGIAAQDSIGNFFAGISLNLDQTYQLGDMLQLEDGTRGTVTDISIRSTTILTLDSIEVTVPNSFLNNSRIINESSPRRRRRISIAVGVAYSSDLDRVEATLLDAARETTIVLDDPAPIVRYQSFGDSAIDVEVHCFISHPGQWARARHELVREISNAFEEEELKIPFPQRELSFDEAGNAIRINDAGRSSELSDDA